MTIFLVSHGNSLHQTKEKLMNKKHNFWGDPDDEPLPDWMNPETYRNGGKPKRFGKTLEQAINDVLKKPPMIQEGMHIPLQNENRSE